MELITTNNNHGFFNDLWPSIFKDFNYVETTKNNQEYNIPNDNILENKDGFLIELMIPGFKKEEITVNIEENKLIVFSNTENQDQETLKIIKKGFNKSKFRKEYKLAETIDKKNIQCSYSEGILSIKLAKIKKLITKQNIKIK